MTKSENDLLALASKVSMNVGMTTMGAIGGGPPLRYVWIPIAPVVAVALLLWCIG